MTITKLPSAFIGRIGTYLINTERAISSSVCTAFKKAFDISNRVQLKEQTNFLNRLRTTPNASLVSKSLSNRSWEEWHVNQPSHQAVREHREKIVRFIKQDLHVFDRNALLEEDFLNWVDVDHSDLWTIEKMQEIVNGIAEKKDDLLISFFEKLTQHPMNQSALKFLQELPADITFKETAKAIREWLKVHGSEVTLDLDAVGNALPVEIIDIPMDAQTKASLISGSIFTDNHELVKALLLKNSTPLPILVLLSAIATGRLLHAIIYKREVYTPEYFRTFAQYANADDHKLDNIDAFAVKHLMDVAGECCDLESFNNLIEAFKKGGHQGKLLESGKLFGVDIIFKELFKRKVSNQLIEAVWNFYQEFPPDSINPSELINIRYLAEKHKNQKLMTLIEERLGRGGRWGKVAAVVNANNRLLSIPGKLLLGSCVGAVAGMTTAALLTYSNGAKIPAVAIAAGFGMGTGGILGLSAGSAPVEFRTAFKLAVNTGIAVAGMFTFVAGGYNAVDGAIIQAIGTAGVGVGICKLVDSKAVEKADEAVTALIKKLYYL